MNLYQSLEDLSVNIQNHWQRNDYSNKINACFQNLYQSISCSLNIIFLALASACSNINKLFGGSYDASKHDEHPADPISVATALAESLCNSLYPPKEVDVGSKNNDTSRNPRILRFRGGPPLASYTDRLNETSAAQDRSI